MLSLFAFLSGAQLAAAACNRDNCLRAIIGENQTWINRIFTVSTSDILLASAFPQRHGSADCALYFLQDAGIPTYASACSGSVRYSSACSCIGVTNALPNVISITSSTTKSTTVSTTTSTTSLSTACTTTTTMTSTTSTFLTSTQTTTSTTATTGSSPVSGWVALGCYEDAEDDFQSGIAQQTSFPTPFTLQSCATDCAGFNYFAVGNSYLCACFTPPIPNFPSVPQSSCVVPCVGDPATYCGGGFDYTGYYEFYQLDSVP